MPALTAQPSLRETLIPATDLASAIGTGTEYALLLSPSSVPVIGWQTIFTDGNPASITVTLEGSEDGLTWATIDTSTSTTGEIRTLTGVYRFVRANNSAVSTGTGITLTVYFSYSHVTRLSATRFNTLTRPVIECEFLGTSPNGPIGGVNIAGGSSLGTAAAVNHPGILVEKAGAGGNSGHAWGTTSTAILISGGESCIAIFQMVTTSGVVGYIGFEDTFTAAAPTDSVCFKINETTLSGQCSAGGSTTGTGTTYTITTGVWYNAQISINAGATLATFALFNATGTLLWSDTIALNIPTLAGQDTGLGSAFIKTSAGAADLVKLDYLAAMFNTALVR